MAARRIREPNLEVKLVSVEVDDADARLRHVYRLLLKAADRNRVPQEIESTNRVDEEEQATPE